MQKKGSVIGRGERGGEEEKKKRVGPWTEKVSCGRERGNEIGVYCEGCAKEGITDDTN